MTEYATITVSYDGQGMPRLLLKKNLAAAMGLVQKEGKSGGATMKNAFMGIFDEKTKILKVVPVEEFKKKVRI